MGARTGGGGVVPAQKTPGSLLEEAGSSLAPEAGDSCAPPAHLLSTLYVSGTGLGAVGR